MLNLDFLDEGVGIVSPAHFSTNCPSCYILLIDQISLSGCLYCAIYCAICLLQFFVNQVVTP